MEQDETDLKTPAWRERLESVWRALKRLWRPVHPAQQLGMGAIPHDEGTAFRVWAPHAGEVFVTGTFNGWQPTRTPLAHEYNGYWSVDVPGARSGDEYKFVIRNGRQTLLRTDPYAKEVTGPHHNGVIRNGRAPRLPFLMPALSELVIYELHVGTFAASEAGPPGTFDDVIKKLPYLKVLGINAIELMPVKEFAGDLSWGYNPAHPFAVSQTYGGREGLKRLIEAAHAHGIAVLVDVVYNHFGPQDLSLWQFDGWRQHELGGIYFYNDWRAQTPWADTRPDYGRIEVRQYIRDNVRMWLDEFQVDGLRWDATSYIRNAYGHDGDPGAAIAEGWGLMQAINEEIRQRDPDRISIAEDLQGNAWITRPTQEAGAGFHAQWDPNFFHPIREAIITPDDEARDMEAVKQALLFRYNLDAFERVIYTESHDEVANGKARIVHEVQVADGDDALAAKRAALGAALVFTAPGVPMIFQGQEFLENGWFEDHRALDWRKAEANAGMVALYRHLIALRRNLNGRTRGLLGQHVNVFHANDVEKLVAFHRWHQGGPGDDVIVVANFSNRPLTAYRLGFPHGGRWQVRFNSDRRAYHPTFAGHYSPPVTAVPDPYDDLPYQGVVSLGPYAVLILSQD